MGLPTTLLFSRYGSCSDLQYLLGTHLSFVEFLRPPVLLGPLVCLCVAATGLAETAVLDARAVTIPVFALIGIASNLKAESNSSGLDHLAGST